MLNTITEHDSQDAFKNGTSAGKGAYARKGTISRVMVVRGPKLTSPGNYGWLFVY
jgi:hypothetical protein